MSSSKKEKKDQKEANEDAKEFVLLKQMMNEHEARKRIRGPYRKSYHPHNSQKKR
ncbi:MAG TPA: hypothetical protein VEH06_06200 [Candidatus Bathyarchaeia archaeon]|nr:hypothetical protein [Candidatus Bathyarchaeia archaeon]